MLCDNIVAEGFGEQYGGFHKQFVTPFVDKIARAQKFVLATDFAQAADELSGHLTDVVKALEFVRLPYPLMWMEVVHADRARFVNGSPPAQFQYKPSRVGFL